MVAKRVADNPSSSPLNLMARQINEENYKRIERLINTAYHIVKNEQPFVSFEWSIDLLKKNGVDMGSQYHTDVACRR